MSESIVYRGGLPYAPDVKRLNDAFAIASLTEGRVITHMELEGVLACKSKSARYYAVINSWIHQQKNANGILMRWEPTVGVKIMNPADVLAYAETRTRQKLTQTGKAVRMFAYVDRARLDEVGQRRLDHQIRVANAIRESANSAKKELAVDLAPVKSLPKPKLIREA